MRSPLGVMLLNLGGPDSLDAVPRFMRNLFLDPDIFRFPLNPITQPIFARMLTRFRSRRVQSQYARIGGKSPLLDLTRAQAIALRATMRGRGVEIIPAIAMRYWRPFTDEALDTLEAAGAGPQFIVLPLYPHFSIATTGSSINELDRCLKRRGQPKKYALVRPWGDHPRYIAALVERIKEALRSLPEQARAEARIFFSAHGLPKSFIERGDPYVTEIRETVSLVSERFDRPSHLAFQSRVGPVKWIGPPIEEKLAELAREGAKHLIVVPVSFVSDHIETLFEIDIEYGRVARELDFETFQRIRSLNGSPIFIDCLADLVEKAAQSLA